MVMVVEDRYKDDEVKAEGSDGLMIMAVNK